MYFNDNILHNIYVHGDAEKNGTYTVCASVSPEPYIQTSRDLLRMLPISVAWSSRQRCNRLCTSGLVDDVTLSHNGPNGAGDASGCSWKWLTRGNTDFTSQRILWLTHQGAAQDQGEVWCPRWPLFCRTTSFANAQCKSTVELSYEVNVNTSWTESQKIYVSKIAILLRILSTCLHKTLTRVFTQNPPPSKKYYLP